MKLVVRDIADVETDRALRQAIDPEKYYEHPSMSNSELGELEKSIRATDPKEAYAFGNLVDHIITEPEKVDVYKSTCNGDVFTETQMQKAIAMKISFMRDELACKIYKMSTYQTIMHKRICHVFENVKFELNARCKWDLWMPRFGWGADIKTTTATTEAQFRAACSYFHYPRQRFLYMTLGGSDRDMIIGISKKNFKVFKIPIKKGDDFWNEGKEDYERLVIEYWKRYGE